MVRCWWFEGKFDVEFTVMDVYDGCLEVGRLKFDRDVIWVLVLEGIKGWIEWYVDVVLEWVGWMVTGTTCA